MCDIRLFITAFLRCRNANCFSKRRGTLFSCPQHNLFSKQGLIEYEVYETVDVSEHCWEQRQIQGGTMQSIPAAARRVKQWVKKRTNKQAFTTYYLSKLPEFFLHYQIEQVFLLVRYIPILFAECMQKFVSFFPRPNEMLTKSSFNLYSPLHTVLIFLLTLLKTTPTSHKWVLTFQQNFHLSACENKMHLTGHDTVWLL